MLAATVVVATAPAAVPEPAHADDTTVRVYSVTFNGFGTVEQADGGDDWEVNVDTYNPAILADECSAIVFLGTAPADVVSCRFVYSGYFKPVVTWPCTGEALATGTLLLWLPGGIRTFHFRMRAVVDEGTVYGFGSEYTDTATGEVRTGYAEFDFAHPVCGSRAKNFGRALY